MADHALQILVVEDNPTDVLLLAEALEEVQSSKFTLTHAPRLDEALRCLHDRAFDVVLLDLGLPDSQGLETFTRLQHEHPAIPILIMSGLEDDALAVQAVQDGAQDFLVKGKINGSVLSRTIRYGIERKRSEQRVLASEVGYRRLFETAQDGIFILDAETGQITDANPFLEQLLGYGLAELAGKRLWEISPFRDKAASRAAFATLQEKGYVRFDTLPLMTKAGGQVEVEFISNVYAVGSQRVIQCNIRDITLRKQAEAKQSLLVQGLNQVVALADELLAAPDLDCLLRQAVELARGELGLERCSLYLIDHRSQTLCGTFGTTLGGETDDEHEVRAPLAGFWAEQLLLAGTLDNNLEAAVPGAATDSGHAQKRWALDAHHPLVEYRMQDGEIRPRPTGLTGWVAATPIVSAAGSIGVMFNDAGRADAPVDETKQELLVVYCSLLGNLIERLRTEERLQQVVKGAHCLLLEAIVEAQGPSFHWNTTIHSTEAAQEYLPVVIPPGRTYHNGFNLAKHAEDVARLEATAHEALRSGQPGYTQEYRLRCADGSIRWLYEDMRITPRGPGQWHLIGVCTDITERKQAEQKLRESEQRFQNIVANTPGTVYQFVSCPDGSVAIPFVNEGCRDLFEMEPEELQRHPTFPIDTIHPADRVEHEASVVESMRTLEPWSCEWRIQLPSGKTKWVQGAAQPRRLPDGGTLWDGLLMDITARKAAEEERDRFFTLSLDMLAIIGSDGYFKRLNPAFEATLGFTNSELMAVPFLEFVHPDDVAGTLAGMAILEGGQQVVYENRYRCRDGSYKWLHWMAAPYEDLWYCVAHDITDAKATAAALYRVKDDLEVRVQERTADLAAANADLQIQIVEREGAEAETRTRARQQEAVAELGQRALAGIDMDALLSGATALVTATLGVDLSTVLELLPGGDSFRVRAHTGWKTDISDRLISGQSHAQAGYALLHSAPTIVRDLRAETRFEPSQLLLDEGIASGVTVVLGGYTQPFGTLGAHTCQDRHFTQNDVHFLQAMANVLAAAIERSRIETEIRLLNAQLTATNEQLRTEDLERQMALGALRDATVVLKQSKEDAEQARAEADAANRAKSEFLSRMSHELRTPMNAILGFGQVLEMRGLGPKESQSVAYILKAGHHLLELINEVLDISRIEAGHMSLSLEPVCVADIVSEALDLVRSEAAQRHIQLDCAAALACPHYVLADRQRLKQVLINLFSNAVKYNAEQGRLTVSAQTVADRVRIGVTDTGHGLAPEEISKLFVPFERLRAEATEVEGTGLGLALSKRLIEAMAGTLTAASAPHQGSTFTIDLPLAEYPLELGPAQHSAKATEVAAAAPAATSTVLAIEDNASNYQLIQTVLEDRPGIKLLSATQGNAGLDLACQHRPDLILLDLHLPDIMGWEVLRRLRATPATCAIPIVVISADATARQIERLLTPPEGHRGADAYLTKPLNVQELLRVVDMLLLKREVTEVV